MNFNMVVTAIVEGTATIDGACAAITTTITITTVTPCVIPAVRSNWDHERAVVWLRAYKQAREERLRGRVGEPLRS